MDFILNENSLDGQFTTVNDFLDSLGENINCIKLIKKNEDNLIYKTRDFYECRITPNHRILDLRQVRCSDKLQRFQLALDQEVYSAPYWDDEDVMAHNLGQTYYFNGMDVTATCIAEAAERNQKLLSFYHKDFSDCRLTVNTDDKKIEVESVYTEKYLLKTCGEALNLDKDSEVKIIYKNTRIDCSKIDSKFGMNQLCEEDYKNVLSTLDKFVSHESWESICLDDGLEYKKYSPESRKKNWFSGTIYQHKQIMKIRASSVLRIYGYRKNDRFVVLRIETDHKISDYG